jgi:hypothetical protein
MLSRAQAQSRGGGGAAVRGASSYPGGIQEPQLLDYRYGLVDMHRVNCAGLLVQDNPDALVLAVLCDFGGREPQEVVSYIVRRLG